MPDSDALNILLLVDSLPAPSDPDPLFHFRNVFVSRPMLELARKHRVSWPFFSPRFPGLTRALYSLRGGEVHFPNGRDYLKGLIRTTRIAYFFLPRISTSLKSRALLRHIRNSGEKYDLIHCHSVFDLGLAGLAARREFGLPLVVSVYGTDVNWLFESGARRASPRIASATREVLAGADRVICVSQDLLARVESLGVTSERLRWVPNGVDTDLFTPGDRAAARGRLGWPSGDRIILFVGNLLETKGIMQLVEAVEALVRAGESPPRLILAGPDRGFETELRRKVASAGLGERVEFSGPKCPEEIPDLLRACDLFCLPSWREGWPLSLVEALACGCPMVATWVGGIPEIVTDPEIGILCPPRDSAALAAALAAALERNWDRGLIAAAAAPFAYSRLAGQIESVYREVCPAGLR